MRPHLVTLVQPAVRLGVLQPERPPSPCCVRASAPWILHSPPQAQAHYRRPQHRCNLTQGHVGHFQQCDEVGQTSTSSHTWPLGAAGWQPLHRAGRGSQPPVAGGLQASCAHGHSLGQGSLRPDRTRWDKVALRGALGDTAPALTTRCWPWSGPPPAGCSAPRPPARARSSAEAPRAGRRSRSSPPEDTCDSVTHQGPDRRPRPCSPAPPTYPVFAVRQAIVPDLHCQVGREQAVPQGQVTAGQKGRSASCAGGVQGTREWDRLSSGRLGFSRWAGSGVGDAAHPRPVQSPAPRPALGTLEGPGGQGLKGYCADEENFWPREIQNMPGGSRWKSLP